MPLVNGIWQYEELENVGPTFSGFLNKLGDSIRTALNPTVTSALTPGTGWTAETSRITKVGNMVTLNMGMLKGTAFTINDIMGALPAGYRPLGQTIVGAAQDFGGGPAAAAVLINSTGQMLVFTANVGGARRMSFCVTYPVA